MKFEVWLLAAAAAIAFARLVKASASEQNPEIQRARRKRRFRIGVATGEYTIQRRVDVLGQLREFRVAGLVIIEAARIQAECPDDQILLSAETFAELPPRLKAICKKRRPIKTKKHERRTLSAYKLQCSQLDR